MESTNKLNTIKYKFIRLLLLFIYYICGILSIVSGFISLFGGEYNNWVFPIVITICGIIFLCQILLKKYVVQFAFLTGVFTILFLFKNTEITTYLSNIIINIYNSGSLDNYEITYFLILLAIVSAEFILGIFELKYSLLYFGLIMFIVLSSPLIGNEIPFINIILLFISLIGIHILSNSTLKSVITTVSSFTIVLIVLAFITSTSITKYNNKLFDLTDDINSFVTAQINNLTSQRYTDYSTGKVSRGNNYQTGLECVEIWLSKQPTEDVYLKDFEGGNYIGNQWLEADEGQFYNALAYDRGWTRWGNYIETMYKEIYYNANSSSEFGNSRKARTITINPILKNIQNRYYPYVGRWEHLTRKDDIAYVYSYYEIKDLNINTTNMDYQTLNRYNDMKENYEPYVFENYLNVPTELVPNLTELCNNINYTNLDEITNFIKTTLNNSARYTLTPGMAPINKDIIEYFMFENKRGYCVHFASTATLMYRMFGIPARYVTGYKIDASLFTEDENNTFYGKALDRNAHAWVEIYIRDKGWIPIEVTPSTGIINNTERITNETTSFYTTSEEITENTTATNTINMNTNNIAPQTLNRYIISLFIIITIILIIYLRRIILLGKIKKYDTREYFQLIIKMINSYGIKCNGLEDDFTDIMLKSLSNLQKEHIIKLTDIVYKAAYSNISITNEELCFVKEQYKIITKEINNKSNVLKRIYNKLFAVYY